MRSATSDRKTEWNEAESKGPEAWRTGRQRNRLGGQERFDPSSSSPIYSLGFDGSLIPKKQKRDKKKGTCDQKSISWHSDSRKKRIY